MEYIENKKMSPLTKAILLMTFAGVSLPSFFTWNWYQETKENLEQIPPANRIEEARNFIETYQEAGLKFKAQYLGDYIACKKVLE